MLRNVMYISVFSTSR